MPASRRKYDVRSHIMRTTSGRRGTRYGGSSMTNGRRLPRSGRRRRDSTQAATSAVTALNRYMPIIIRPCTGNTPSTWPAGNSAAMISV